MNKNGKAFVVCIVGLILTLATLSSSPEIFSRDSVVYYAPSEALAADDTKGLTYRAGFSNSAEFAVPVSGEEISLTSRLSDSSRFAKCGTTSLGYWLRNHLEVRKPKAEVVNKRQDPLKTAARINQIIKNKGPGVTGYRNPHDIQYKETLAFYRNTCPKTKHLVLVRHPLLWFESFYNYRKMNKGQNRLMKAESPNNLTGPECMNQLPYFVCAETAAFHRYLAKLMKTNLSSDEMELLSPFKNEFMPRRPRVDNPVFLLETSQLSDYNETRSGQLGRDIQKYLGLFTPMPPIPHANNGADLKKNSTSRRRKEAINICDEQYHPIHGELMKISKNASLWIRHYFLKSPDVMVSSLDHFVDTVKDWMIDPCAKRHDRV